MRTRYIYPCLIQKPTPLKQTDQNRPGRKCKTHPKLHTKKIRHMNTRVSKRGTQKINQKL
jgi:hypothetical protein